MSFLIWKFVHIASAVIFLGNITTGVFWGAHAHRSGDLKLLSATFEGIVRSDRWFTLPGVLGIVTSGVALAMATGRPLLGTGWIFWTLVLFSISGAVFHFQVGPLQKKIRDAAAADDRVASDNYFRRWGFWGGVALLTPIAALVLMVLKPTLPAF